MRQEKIDQFKAIRDELLAPDKSEPVERRSIALARMSTAAGDREAALSIYKKALDSRTTSGNSQKPEWMESYDALLKETSEQ